LQPANGTDFLLEAEVGVGRLGETTNLFVGQKILVSLPAEQLFLFADLK